MNIFETFRAETRAWLEANCPPEMRQPMQSEKDVCWGGRNWTFQSPGQSLWLERMAGKGWTAPEWPRQYGGGGLSREEAKVLAAEMRKIGCRTPLHSFGIWMLGPALAQIWQ
jgi:acyl-CoA dehydrogenase